MSLFKTLSGVFQRGEKKSSKPSKVATPRKKVAAPTKAVIDAKAIEEAQSKAQEILQPFPDMLNEMEQTMLDVNNKLSDATPEKRSFMVETCKTLLNDMKEIEKDASQESAIIEMF